MISGYRIVRVPAHNREPCHYRGAETRDDSKQYTLRHGESREWPVCKQAHSPRKTGTAFSLVSHRYNKRLW